MGSPGELPVLTRALASFSPGARALLLSGAQLRRLRPAERIFDQGDASDGLYLVESGAVEVWLRREDRDWLLTSLSSGSILGEMSLLSGDLVRHNGARAGGQGAAVAHLSMQLLDELRLAHPIDHADGARALAADAAARLDVANHRLIERLSLERAEGMRRDLLVHDLRSPLASIDSGVSALLQRPDVYGQATPKQRSALVRIGKNAAFLRLLIDSVLEVERARQTPTEARTTTLREVLTAIAAPLLSLVAPEKWLELGDEALLGELSGTRLSLPGAEAQSAPLLADPLRLGQVLLNLIGNAVRYTEGPVSLSVKAAGGQVSIDVTDQGPGIPADKREAIFDAFKQRELQDARLPVGKGFGLAGVRELVRSMGGTIGVIDREDGQRGACFRVALPAAKGAA